MLPVLRKYPRTPHLEGSHLQPGDEDLAVSSPAVLDGRFVVIEEKVDGGNIGISFTPNGVPLLQSRGHYLTGGPRERQFELLKAWVATHQVAFFECLGDRYIMYGEWLFALHTVFYDELPHYFLEFDVFDIQAEAFLSMTRRRELLRRLPVCSVPVLYAGVYTMARNPWRLIQRSHFKGQQWAIHLITAAAEASSPVTVETVDHSHLMEGVYIKVEDTEHVLERYKVVRDSFSTTVLEAGDHWSNRPIIQNRLRKGVDIFAPSLESEENNAPSV
jgi:hypothetical protein